MYTVAVPYPLLQRGAQVDGNLWPRRGTAAFALLPAFDSQHRASFEPPDAHFLHPRQLLFSRYSVIGTERDN